MERTTQDLELYTIPSYSSWFSWIKIHEVERFSLREFFDGSSITRTPRIYKDYRDFIISKFRENPSKKLTFTDIRKSLVGDISVLLKVFIFLEKWGLINFNVGDGNDEKDGNLEEEEEEKSYVGRVKVEEGAPYGVRVVAAPNSMKPIVAPPPPPTSIAGNGDGLLGEMGELGFKWPPLASYSDVYGELMQQEKGLVCSSCKEKCDSGHYECTKESSFILCEKCFQSGNYGESKSTDDFKLEGSANQGVVWTEAETLLLLESVLKHGDDWDLVAKNVQTKSKSDCISKLIELPFGDLMLGAPNRKILGVDKSDNIDSSKQVEPASDEPQESVKSEDPSDKPKDNDGQIEDTENESPRQKRLCTGLTSDVSGSLMKQVTRISAILGPQVTVSATEAAVTALCYENQCSRELLDDDDSYDDTSASPSDHMRAAEVDNAVEGEKPKQSGKRSFISFNSLSDVQEKSTLKNIIPLNLRARAATAAALGAAAANAKLLADKEEREMGQLVATIIESQLKKIRRKMKYFDDLEVIMQKEHSQLEELEECLVAERINVLQRVFSAGINKSSEHSMAKHQIENVQ